uniref:Putative secreted protein n=1 Tax=Anopheles darlingi TaxID=43151 RepID=A0A2M4D877_ANODA
MMKWTTWMYVCCVCAVWPYFQPLLSRSFRIVQDNSEGCVHVRVCVYVCENETALWSNVGLMFRRSNCSVGGD